MDREECKKNGNEGYSAILGLFWKEQTMFPRMQDYVIMKDSGKEGLEEKPIPDWV